MYVVIWGIIIGFILDLFLGDPAFLPHPIVAIGKLIGFFEKRLIQSKNQVMAGGLMVFFVCAISFMVPFAILFIAFMLSPLLCIILNGIMCYFIFATKCLGQASNHVASELKKGTEAGRVAVSQIVGRDTSSLSEKGVIRATVETVAENTTDGVVAPLIFMAFGGAPFAFLYKAINTMDSMVGYRNEKYCRFGKVAAKLDDVANFVPARITAFLMMAAAFFCGYDASGAAKIWARDKKKHASPNSAQTEAVCAGALNIRLAGDAVYFGKEYKKPYIGDEKREIEIADIKRTNKLMYTTAVLGVAVVLFAWFGVILAANY